MSGTETELPPHVRRIAIIVAAGKGERAGSGMPKQFVDYLDKPLLMHSIEAFADWPLCDAIIVVIAPDQIELAQSIVGNEPNVSFVAGGDSRRQSVLNALQSIASYESDTRVFIHDAARPGLSLSILDRLDNALDSARGAIPALPVVDSLCRADDLSIVEHIDRTELWRIQTPQAFHFGSILKAHGEWNVGQEATDDAMVLRASGEQVVIVEGDEALQKITYASDFSRSDLTEPTLHNTRIFRTGIGYDVHRLASGDELWLCGIKMDHEKGLAGHSDADVALHALTDALLGAMALGDIGEHFPPSDPRWKGASSEQFVKYAAGLVRAKHGEIINVDLTIICEAPKIGPYRQQMRQSVADMLDLSFERVSIKATTTERLGFTGREEGIATQAITTVAIPDHQE